MAKSYMPRYVEIQQYLAKKIRDGEFREGDLLPTEQELQKMFGVSRITVTTALREMVKDGIIYRVQGKGTFVAETKKELDIYKMVNTSIAENAYDLHASGVHRLVEAKEEHPGEKVSSILGLKPHERAVRIERVKLVDQRPFSVERTWLPEKLYPGILGKDLESAYIIELMKEDYGIHLARNVMYAEPVLSDGNISKHLEVKKGSPILLWAVENYDREGMPVGYTEAYIRGDRAKFVIRHVE